MASILGGGTTSTSSSSSTSPWGAQQAPVSSLLNDASGVLSQQAGTASPFSGSDLYAGLNSTEQGALSNMNAAGAASGALAAPTMAAGSAALNGLGTATNTATNLATGNFNQGSNVASNIAAGNAGTAVAATNAGTAGAQQAISANNAGNLATEAGTLTNNSVLQGQIDAANLDTQRNLDNNTLPTLNAQAVAAGGLNSSRAGAASAIASAQAQETEAQTAATMRSNAYNSGLQLAAGQNATNISGQLGVANAGTSATNTAIAGNTASNTNTNNNNALLATGANLLNTQANTGLNALTTGNNLGVSGAGQQLQAGQVQQQDQQGQDNANLQAWQLQQQAPWMGIDNASNVIQDRNWGSTTDGTTTQTQTDAPLSDGIAAAGALGSLFAPGTTTTGANGATTTTGSGILSNVIPAIGSGLSSAASYIGSFF